MDKIISPNRSGAASRTVSRDSFQMEDLNNFGEGLRPDAAMNNLLYGSSKFPIDFDSFRRSNEDFQVVKSVNSFDSLEFRDKSSGKHSINLQKSQQFSGSSPKKFGESLASDSSATIGDDYEQPGARNKSVLSLLPKDASSGKEDPLGFTVQRAYSGDTESNIYNSDSIDSTETEHQFELKPQQPESRQPGEEYLVNEQLALQADIDMLKSGEEKRAAREQAVQQAKQSFLLSSDFDHDKGGMLSGGGTPRQPDGGASLRERNNSFTNLRSSSRDNIGSLHSASRDNISSLHSVSRDNMGSLHASSRDNVGSLHASSRDSYQSLSSKQQQQQASLQPEYGNGRSSQASSHGGSNSVSSQGIAQRQQQQYYEPSSPGSHSYGGGSGSGSNGQFGGEGQYNEAYDQQYNQAHRGQQQLPPSGLGGRGQQGGAGAEGFEDPRGGYDLRQQQQAQRGYAASMYGGPVAAPGAPPMGANRYSGPANMGMPVAGRPYAAPYAGVGQMPAPPVMGADRYGGGATYPPRPMGGAPAYAQIPPGYYDGPGVANPYGAPMSAGGQFGMGAAVGGFPAPANPYGGGVSMGPYGAAMGGGAGPYGGIPQSPYGGAYGGPVGGGMPPPHHGGGGGAQGGSHGRGKYGYSNRAANTNNLISAGLYDGTGTVYVVQLKCQYRHYVLDQRAPQYLKPGDFVIVDADRGEDLGIIIELLPMMAFIERQRMLHISLDDEQNEVGRILRQASMYEREQLPGKYQDELLVIETTENLAHNNYHMQMIVVDADYQFDRQKLTIYYDSAIRVDFRELVRDLFATFKTRIWFKKANNRYFKAKQYAVMGLATGQSPNDG